MWKLKCNGVLMMSENIPEVMLALQNKLHGRFAPPQQRQTFILVPLRKKNLFIWCPLKWKLYCLPKNNPKDIKKSASCWCHFSNSMWLVSVETEIPFSIEEISSHVRDICANGYFVLRSLVLRAMKLAKPHNQSPTFHSELLFSS